jgi:hypothetical protein
MAHSLGSVLSYDILCNQPDLYSALNVRPLSTSASDRRSSAQVRPLLSLRFPYSLQPTELMKLCVSQTKLVL